jgi:hypothetical protein
MNRTAALAKRASDLSRRLYASLPLSYRIARLLIDITASANTAFGMFAYALFIRAGVPDIPDINGHPALDLQPALQADLNALNKLSFADRRALASISGKFGEFTYAIFLKKYHNPELVEEGISRTNIDFVRNPDLIHAVPLAQAKNYVLNSVDHNIMDVIRHSKKFSPMSMPVDEEGNTLDLEDPRAFKNMERMVSPTVMHRIVSDLGNIHPLGPVWLECKLEGEPQTVMAEQLGITPSRIVQLLHHYEPAFEKVILKHISDAAAA